MTDPAEARLRRLFAEAPAVGADETFVTAVAGNVAARRRRRAWLLASWVVVALALAALLAPYAPSLAGFGRLGNELGGVSDLAASLPAYIYYMLAACALPLGLGLAIWMMGSWLRGGWRRAA